LIVTIGQDGTMTEDPHVTSPIDNDDFSDDVKTVVKKLHQCEPFIVDPSGLNKGPFKQQFTFLPKEQDDEVAAAIREHFRNCWKRPATGPDVKVELKYKLDGTFAEPPRPLDPEHTAEYSLVAASVIDQLSKCPPLEFSQDKYSQVQQFTWTFSTVESNAAYILKKQTCKWASDPAKCRQIPR
jgi:hypothetical protein